MTPAPESILDAAIASKGGPRLAPVAILARDTDERHPFLRFLPLGGAPTAPEMVLDDVMQAGQVVLTGPRGCGKSTIALRMAMLAAHLCREDHALRPKLRRAAVYIAEDVQQAMLIATAIARREGPSAGFSVDDVRERIRFVQASQLSAEDIADAAAGLLELGVENVSRLTGSRFTARPLVVLDTRNATIAVEDENANAEASRALSILRDRFDVPTLLIAHPAKGNAGSTRGAGAWEADAHQVIYVSVDPLTRARTVHLAADAERDAKRRFESDVDYLLVESDVVTFEALDPLGETVDMRIRFCDLAPEAAAEKKLRIDEPRLREVFEAVREGATTINAIQDAIGGRRRTELVEVMEKNGWLYYDRSGAGTGGNKRGTLKCTAIGLARFA